MSTLKTGPEEVRRSRRRSLQSGRPARHESEHVAAAPSGQLTSSLLQLQRTVGNRTVSGLLQRRGAGLPAAAALRDAGPVWLPGGGDDLYDTVLEAVEEYPNDAKVPAADFGKQVHVLLNRIADAITKWEAVNGPVNAAVASGLFGLSRTDKRRLVLKRVRDALNVEVPVVQQQGFAAATAAHNQDRAALKQYLLEGRSSADRRLANSCEWIMTAGKAKLYAVTATGDSYARLSKAGKNPNRDEAWFPKGTQGSPGDLMSEPPATYNKDNIADNTGVTLDEDGKITGGWNTPALITITKPSNATKETVWETLRHEVQHDADKNKGRDAQADVRAAAEAVDVAATGGAKNLAKGKLDAEGSLQRYKTEYRAYSYQEGTAGGPYAMLDNSVQNQPFGGKSFSARQLAIFRHIYSGYAYTKTHWDADSELVSGKKFRDAVVEYWDPDTEGVNKYNSPRVDDFWLRLDALGSKKAATTEETTGSLRGRDIKPVAAKVTDPANPGLVDLIKTIAKLDENDVNYVLNESPALKKKIDAHLDGRAKVRLIKNLEKARTGFAKALQDTQALSLASIFD